MRWEAQPRQAEFLTRPEDEVLYGGAAGGGKTDALLIDLIATCQEHPKAQTLFLRKTFADLRKPLAAIPRSHELLTGRATWNGQDHKWTFRNGSVLQFGHVQHEQDVYGYQGSQIDRLAFDELTHFTEFEFNYLRSRVRATVPGIRTGIRAATNPGGIGHGWVKAAFIDGHASGESWTVAEESGRQITRCYVPARVWDNQALLERDPEYPARLALLGEALARALLEGDWDQFEGQVFAEWRHDRHVVQPFRVPPEWPRWRAVDYGFSSPFCCLWLTRAPAGTIYVYRELYATHLLDRDQAYQIRALSAGEAFRASFGDPSMWTGKHNGYATQAPAATYGEIGIGLTPATNDRAVGWRLIHELLDWSEERPPRLQVFATCTNLIRTLPALIYDRHDPEDVDSDGEDHAPDALRYGLMGMQQPQPTKRKVQFR